MKPILTFVLMISMVLSLTGCGTAQKESFDIDSIKSYRDVPGVTEEEIAEIEALQASRDSFSYGSLGTSVTFLLPDGSYAGFTPKICELLSSLFGIEFIPELSEWDDLIGRLNQGSFDFTGELTANPERMERYYMSHTIAEQSFGLYMHANSKPIHTEMELEGLRIGFLKGTITADLIRDKYPISFDIVEIATHKAAAEMLKTKMIDAFVDLSTIDPFFADYDFIRGKNFFHWYMARFPCLPQIPS